MGQEFWWQLKLPVPVSSVKIWKFYKSKDQWKYVLYARRKYSFCHNEVYKGIKYHTKSVLTFIDVWFHTLWVKTDSTYFYSSFTTPRFKVSSFILVPASPEVLRDWAGRFLSYFPRVLSTSSCKNFNNGISLPWILQNNLQAVTAVPFINQEEKGHHHFLERIRTQ